jgi:NADPH:quinone reductase-like Zn-dependent oxidoreductase
LLHKPESLSFEQAASVPHAAALAVQSLRFERETQPGDQLLFNGAGGGAGTLAIQIAKHWGAEVTAVDSGLKLDAMRDLGADHVIDYTKEDFTRSGQRYDRIIDVQARRGVADYARALKPGGVFVMVGGPLGRIFINFALGQVLSRRDDKTLGLLPHVANGGLDSFIELFEAGQVTPIIDRSFTLEQVPEAMRYYSSAQAIGKVVITVDH